MSALLVKRALEIALAGILPALPTAWRNVDFLPPVDGGPWQRADVMFAEPFDLDLGSDSHREQGIFQVSLFYPLLQGEQLALSRVEVIRALFRKGAEFTNGGVRVIIERTPEVSNGLPDGTHWLQPVKIRFYSNIS